MSTKMSVSERESFLAELHVGVLSVADSDGLGPLVVPVGYRYEPDGEIWFTTGSSTRKMELIRAADRVGFLVQTEELPYKYVSVEGPVVTERPTEAEEHRVMTTRYLGPEMGQQYFESTKDSLDEMVTVRIRPERWRTYDSGKELG